MIGGFKELDSVAKQSTDWPSSIACKGPWTNPYFGLSRGVGEMRRHRLTTTVYLAVSESGSDSGDFG